MQSCGVLFDVKQKDHHDKSACQPAQQDGSPQDILYIITPVELCICIHMHVGVYMCVYVYNNACIS